jgi:hypothetical protein
MSEIIIIPLLPEGGGGYTVLPLSVQDIFRHIFLSSVFGPVRFLLPVCRLSWSLYTLNIYAHFSSHFSQQLLMTEI